MGRNKNQQKKIQKSRAVFKVAGHKTLKAKSKAKQVTTNLKKINVKAKEAIEQCDKGLENVQTLLHKKQKKGCAEVAKSNNKKRNAKQDQMHVDVNETANEFKKL